MLNINNLIDNNDNNESIENALTVSQTYDLLNENVNVTWNDSLIKLRSPYSLNSISNISFRSFTGELLPYTSLELPQLQFGIKVYLTNISNDTYSIGANNSIIKEFMKFVNQREYSTDNTLVKFDKIWTYDSSKESQLVYNFEEIFSYLNNIFINWLGSIKYIYKIGLELNLNPLSYTTFFNYNPAEYCTTRVSCMNNGILRRPFINRSNELDFKTYDLSSSSWTNAKCITTSSDTKYIYMELNEHSGADSFNQIVYFNESQLSVSLGSSCKHSLAWQQVGDLCKCIPHAFTKNSSHTCLLIMPYTDISNTRHSMTIYVDGSKQTITDNVPDYFEYNIIGISNVTNSQLNICYVGSNELNTQMYIEFAQINCGASSTYITLRERSLISSELHNYLIKCDFEYLSCGLIWTYSRVHVNSHNISLYNYNRSIYDDTNKNIKILYCEFLQNNSQLDRKYIINLNPLQTSHKLCFSTYSSNEQFTDADSIYNAYVTGVWNPYSSIPKIKITDELCSICEISSTNSSTLSSYYFNEQIINYRTIKCLDEFECYYSNDNDKVYPINTINNKLTYETLDLFKFDSINHIITYPEIYFNNNSKISFIPFIKTEPIYFTIDFSINDNVLKDYSIVTNDTSYKYFEINPHILDTLETLILLKYETNDLKLRCMNFPNNDNIVFSMNEVANVNFKSFNINATGIELICNIVDNENNNIDKETLKKLYGKLIINIDFRS